jgi:hypothetical protein
MTAVSGGPSGQARREPTVPLHESTVLPSLVRLGRHAPSHAPPKPPATDAVSRIPTRGAPPAGRAATCRDARTATSRDLPREASRIHSAVTPRCDQRCGSDGESDRMVRSERWGQRQDHSGARDPVRFFPVDQVPEVVERAERLWALIPARPSLRDTFEETSKSTRRATKHLNCEVEAELHVVLPSRPTVERSAAKILPDPQPIAIRVVDTELGHAVEGDLQAWYGQALPGHLLMKLRDVVRIEINDR